MRSKRHTLLTISEANSLLGIPPQTLQIWEDWGLLQPVRMSSNGTRYFRKTDLLKLHGKGDTNQTFNLQQVELADNVPAIVAVIDMQSGTYRYINKEIEQILGYTQQEFYTGGLSFAITLVHPEDVKEIAEKNRQALKKANQLKRDVAYEPIVNFEYRMKHKNGAWIWLQTNGRVLTRSKNNQVQTVLNVSLDITQRKEVEKNATKNLEHIKYALDQSAIVAITDKSGMIQYVNDKFLEISHYSREELIGKTHRVINSKYHPREFFTQMWNTILSGKVWHGEIRNRTKVGTLYWVDTTVTPLLNENGKPVQFIAIHYEVTRRKQLERQKDEFIGIASHELKTPVTSLKGYVQVMEKRFTKQGDLKSAGLMAKMDMQINKLNSLIQDLLDVTKIETGKLQFHTEVFDLNELVLETIEAMQLTTERHHLLKKGTVNKLVYADRERIGQILINLLSNAIKYSPASDKIIVKLMPEEDYVTVAVIDFGVGIAKEKQSHLFERFYRVTGTTENTFPGLGLGLYISAELIRRHRGRIWLESNSGKGAAFYFTLPWGESTRLNPLIETEIKHE